MLLQDEFKLQFVAVITDRLLKEIDDTHGQCNEPKTCIGHARAWSQAAVRARSPADLKYAPARPHAQLLQVKTTLKLHSC